MLDPLPGPMDAESVIPLALFVLAFGLISRRLDSSIITAPMVFVAVGGLVSATGSLALGFEPWVIDLLAETTLVLVLFSDAARIDVRQLWRERGLPLRLLLLSMPLTIALGAAVAALLFPALSFWEAALLAAILAPTDAALGQAVVSNERVPLRIRQALNVESGLNDGIVLPLVMICAALASAGAEGAEASRSAGEWIVYGGLQVLLGPVVGAAIAIIGGRLISGAVDRKWMSSSFERLGGLSLALLAFLCAEQAGGNGFISAFVAGLSLGETAPEICPTIHEFIEAEGQALMLLVFLLLGGVLAGPALAEATPQMIGYALLSLTLIRMLPTALSLIGARLSPVTTLFLGWFGPRGLASILFGLLIVEDSQAPHREMIFTVVVLTVLLSVIAHGLSANPAAKRYGARLDRARESSGGELPEHAEVVAHPTRVTMKRDRDSARSRA